MQPVAEHIDYKGLYEQQKAVNEELQYQISALTVELEKFKKMLFGSKHERFEATDDNKINLQLKLDLDAETIATCKITDAT
jgi:transposase